MVSLNQSLFTGFTGVQTAQVGLNITGNNIANVNTPGYSRQMPMNIPKGVNTIAGITQGTGADILRIGAARENLANELYTDALGREAYSERFASGMNDIEALLVEAESSGIGFQMSEFFGALEAAVQRPSDIPTRQNVLVKAQNLASEFRGRDGDLFDLQYSTNQDIAELVARVNEITERIDGLNRQISSTAKPPQDLIDDRYNEINELSKLVGVETYEMENNLVQVNIKGTGQILVGREMRNTLETSINAGNSGFYDINLNVKGTFTDITGQMVSGDLAARINLRDGEIPTNRERLDNLAAGLIQQVNAVHTTGTDLNGNAGLNFFDPTNVLGATPVGTVDADRYNGVASTIEVSADLLINAADPSEGFDPTALAFSLGGAVGDNQVALSLVALRNSTQVVDQDRDGDFTNDSTVTYERYHVDTMARLGGVTRSATLDLQTQQALAEQAEVRRNEISGVSLDEEAVSLTQYQRAFEASSRFLGVINQLTADIINRLG